MDQLAGIVATVLALHAFWTPPTPPATVRFCCDTEFGVDPSDGRVFAPVKGFDVGLMLVDTYGTQVTITGNYRIDQLSLDSRLPDTLTLGSEVVGPDDFRGKLEAGIMFMMPEGASVRATGSYDGIGSDDFHAYGGQMWVNLPLH